MFQEDARLYVAPLRSRGDEKFAVEINGEQGDVDRVEALIESISRESYGNRQALFSEAIRQVATYLLWYGVARFELLDARKGEENGYFALQPFPSFGVWRVPGGFVQDVPKQFRDQNQKRFFWIPAGLVWTVHIPRQLGGTRRYRQMQRRLRQNTGFPTLQERALEEGKWSKLLDFSEFRAMSRSELLCSTSLWGWAGRDSSLTYETEFYSVYRTIKFRWATAVLREHITTEFNHLFKRLGLAAFISVQGLSAPDAYNQINQELSQGEIDFAQAYKLINEA